MCVEISCNLVWLRSANRNNSNNEWNINPSGNVNNNNATNARCLAPIVLRHRNKRILECDKVSVYYNLIF